MHTITIANQKGGCGKTTVAINLSASLARESRRVLLVDLDPQGHCAVGMAVPEEQIDLSIVDCLLQQMEEEPLELSRITWQIAPNLALAPSRSNLATLEPKLGMRDDAANLLRSLLEANASRYDYCVIDGPPHMGLLVRNGLCAADEVIIPVETGYFSLHGLTQQLATLEQLGEQCGYKPTVRILANQYDVRTKLAREILAELRKRYEGLVCDSVVNFNTKLKESASFGQPITEFAPKSMGARDFQKLALELMAREPQKVPTSEIVQHVERLAADAERLLATTATLVENRPTTATDAPADEWVASASEGDLNAVARLRHENVNGHAARRMTAAPVAGAPEPSSAPALTEQPSRTVPTTPAVGAAPSIADTPTESAPTRPLPDRAAPTPSAAEPVAQSVLDTAPLAQPAATVVTRPDSPAPLVSESASTEEIERKIEEIYGVKQEADVVIFRNHNPDAREVQLAGDFNDWMPHTTPMQRMAGGDFEARLRLPKGRYRYRLVIDGRWSHDQQNPVVETNEYGELNSVLEVTR